MDILQHKLVEEADKYVCNLCPYARVDGIKNCSQCSECRWHDEALLVYKAFMRGSRYAIDYFNNNEEEII